MAGENPAAFPEGAANFPAAVSLPESAQTLAGIAFRAAGKSGKNFPAASKFAGKPFQQGISMANCITASWPRKSHEKDKNPSKWRKITPKMGKKCLNSEFPRSSPHFPEFPRKWGGEEAFTQFSNFGQPQPSRVFWLLWDQNGLLNWHLLNFLHRIGWRNS